MIAKLKTHLDSAKNHQGFRRYFANASWMMGEQVLRIISGLVVGVWVARYLGPERYGVFSYALAFAAIFGNVSKLGLDSIIVRNLVQQPEKRDAYLGTAFWLKALGSLIALAVVAIALAFAHNDPTTNLYILIITCGFLFQAFETIDFYFQSKVLSKFVSLCKMFQLFLSSILKLYFIFTHADLFWFVLVTLIDQVTLGVALYFAYCSQKLIFFHRHFDIEIAKGFLRDSWPLIFAGFLLVIQARVDQVMLKEMIGNTELGYYSSALRLIESFAFVPMILISSLFPAIVNAKKISAEVYESRLFNLYRLMMVLFLAVAVPIYFFGTPIVILLYKQPFAPAGYLFSLMGIRLFFANYGVARGAYLLTENLTTYSLMTMALGAATNLTMNFLLIPHYQSIGAIWASVTTYFVSTFLIDFFYFRTRKNCLMMLKSMLMFKTRAA